ncbi:MAG: 2-dehydro-3-deoxygluconokinase [Chlamydiae bacterium]|nr:2-dehydro-3-deoxygluconokinase [Chlamydiota bacterium]
MIIRFLLFLFCSFSLFSHEILTYGDAIIDYIVFVDDAFLDNLPGGTGGSDQVDLETFALLTKNYLKKCPGSSSVNTMKGLALLGHSSTVIGRIGNDADGKDYAQSLLSYGITPAFTECNTYTGRIVAMISPDGHRTMRSCVGCLVGFDAFAVAPELFQDISLFHVEGYQIPNFSFLKELATLAKESVALISMDTGCHELVTKFKAQLLDLITNDLDILFTNDEEAFALTGLSPEKACLELAKLCTYVVVTCGEKGGYVASQGQFLHYDAIPVDLVDDTGAGDCFIAGFLHGILTDQPLEKCAKSGALIASKVSQLIGAELPHDLVLEKSDIGDDHEIGVDFVSEDTTNRIEGCTGS